MRSVLCLFAVAFLCVGCATTGSEGQTNLVAAEPAPASVLGTEAAPQQEKQSLSEMLDEHDQVELADDATGETKLICKRVKVTGTRLARQKTCATRKQWDEERRRAQENVGTTSAASAA